MHTAQACLCLTWGHGTDRVVGPTGWCWRPLECLCATPSEWAARQGPQTTHASSCRKCMWSWPPPTSKPSMTSSRPLEWLRQGPLQLDGSGVAGQASGSRINLPAGCDDVSCHSSCAPQYLHAAHCAAIAGHVVKRLLHIFGCSMCVGWMCACSRILPVHSHCWLDTLCASAGPQGRAAEQGAQAAGRARESRGGCGCRRLQAAAQPAGRAAARGEQSHDCNTSLWEGCGYPQLLHAWLPGRGGGRVQLLLTLVCWTSNSGVRQGVAHLMAGTAFCFGSLLSGHPMLACLLGSGAGSAIEHVRQCLASRGT